MKTLYPLYTDKFRCIAGDCPDTCCAQWEIVIDEEFQKLYKAHPSAAARKACNAMYTDDDGDVCLKLNNGRCPMLNKDNLCELYIDMGKDSLCDVCRIYPRFNKDVNDTCFGGISLSCPEAARLILSVESCGRLSGKAEFADDADEFIWECYTQICEFIKDGCFFSCPGLACDIQDELDFSDTKAAREILKSYTPDCIIPSAEEVLKYADLISGLEFLTDDWKELTSELTLHLKNAISDNEYQKKRDAAFITASRTKELINIEIYYLYKYIAEAIEYADIMTNVKTAFICSAVICELYAIEIIKNGSIDFDKKLRIAQLFSKEIEHNEDNMKKLQDM